MMTTSVTAQTPNRFLAFLAYLIPLVGALLVLLIGRRNVFALYHACQALGIWLTLILVPVGWLVFGWLAALIPLAGPVVAAGSFALVIAAYIAAVIAWIGGIMNVLRTKYEPAPILGDWGLQTFSRFTA